MAELEKLRVKALGLLNNCRDNIASKEASAAIRSQIVGILSDLKKYQGEEKSSLNEITEQIQAYIHRFLPHLRSVPHNKSSQDKMHTAYPEYVA